MIMTWLDGLRACCLDLIRAHGGPVSDGSVINCARCGNGIEVKGGMWFHMRQPIGRGFL